MSNSEWHNDQAAGERVQREWEEETRKLREENRILHLAVRVALAFQRPTIDNNAHLLDVERVSTSADLVGYLRNALANAAKGNP